MDHFLHIINHMPYTILLDCRLSHRIAAAAGFQGQFVHKTRWTIGVRASFWESLRTRFTVPTEMEKNIINHDFNDDKRSQRRRPHQRSLSFARSARPSTVQSKTIKIQNSNESQNTSHITPSHTHQKSKRVTPAFFFFPTNLNAVPIVKKFQPQTNESIPTSQQRIKFRKPV